MKNTSLESLMKQGIIEGVLNSSVDSRVQLEQLYSLLLNDPQLSKLKPFNMPRHIASISDTTGIFRMWLSVNSGDSNDVYIRGRRVSRAVDRLASEYNDIFPEQIRGANSFAILLRVFFVQSDFILTSSPELSAALVFTSFLMRTVLLLDMLFAGVTIAHQPAEHWLKLIMSSASSGLHTVVAEIQAKGGFWDA